MALPGSRGGPATEDQAVELAEKYSTILRLRLQHKMPWAKIGVATGYSPGHAKNIFYEQKGTEAGRLTIEAHREALFSEYEKIADTLRPWVTGESPVDVPHPDKDDVRLLLDVLREKARLIGTDAPKQTAATTTVTHQVRPSLTPHADRKANRTAVLAELLQHHPLSDQEILDVDSYVEMPTGDSTGAPTSNGYGPATNGHGPRTNGMH